MPTASYAHITAIHTCPAGQLDSWTAVRAPSLAVQRVFRPSSAGAFQVLGHPAEDVDRGQVLLLGYPTDQQLPRRLDPLQQPGVGPGARRDQLQPVAVPCRTHPLTMSSSITRRSAPGSSTKNGFRASAI